VRRYLEQIKGIVMHRSGGVRVGALVGFATTAALAGMLYLLAQLQVVAFIPLDIAEAIVQLTPGAIATQGIEAFGPLAKILIEVSSILVFLSAGTLVGAVIARRRFHTLLPGSLVVGLVGLALTLLIQVMAGRLPDAPSLGGTALALLGWAVLLVWLLRRALAAPARVPEAPITRGDRRAFLVRSGGALLTVAVGSAAIGELLRQATDAPLTQEAGGASALPGAALAAPATASAGQPSSVSSRGPAAVSTSVNSTAPSSAPSSGPAPSAPAAAQPRAPTSSAAPAHPTVEPGAGAGVVDDPAFAPGVGVRPELTPAEQLYIVQATFSPPRVDASQWRLVIKGLVDHPLTLSYDELRALPRIDQTSTLTCISNEVGGKLIGNITWSGTRLRDLLQLAGVQPGAVDVVLRSLEGYTDSIPLERALSRQNLIVYGMNGAALTRNHGFPARLIVPGIYGMKNVKWLKEIEVVGEDYQGFWQKRGWSDTAIVKTQAALDTGNPALGNEQTVPLEDGQVVLGGYAFAGDRGISAVEVRIDGGDWQPAQLKQPTSQLTWREWRYAWAAKPGTHTVVVRATDGDGQLQTSENALPHPDGASGWHTLQIVVAR
jgi:DMSO/TMAO reductase YedYZ molybdopterin-dependent catalytic subunit